MFNLFLSDTAELNKCLLCHDAPCSKACIANLTPDRILRKMYFANYSGAAKLLGDIDCASCQGPCATACVLQATGKGVNIRQLMQVLQEKKDQLLPAATASIDISTDICGVKLENPFVLSSSVVSSSYEMCARAFECGWAGASLKTICSFPQHEASPRFSALQYGTGFAGFKNIEQLSGHTVDEDMEIIRKLKQNYPHKVIIASIMGQNEEEWTMLAQKCEAAGADVIECNFSCPNMEDSALGITIGQSPELVERFTSAVRKGTALPVLAKLTPNVADMVPAALAAKSGGADGLAAINTINSITGIDLDSLVAEPAVNGKSMIGGYSGRAVKPIALRFINDLARTPELQDMHISGMGGVADWRDAVEFLALGAGSIQVTTAVMEYGYRIIDDLLEGLQYFLQEKGFAGVKDLIGISRDTVVDHDAVERDTVAFPIIDMTKCIGCGRCYLSCSDGGHQAIAFDKDKRKPTVNGSKCVGCHLCRLVCPASAISSAKKRISRS